MGWGNLFSRKTSTDPAYKAFTSRYDCVVRGEHLDSVLGRPDPASLQALESAWQEFRNGLSGWKTKTSFEIMEFVQVLRAQLPEEERRETVVTLLLDQSGSMRGHKMLMTAMLVDIVQSALKAIQVRCEILGFTTVAWQGGNSRKLWKRKFRPRNPGRLNDLLHVIYVDADDERPGTEGYSFRAMLRPDFPKENIDGEALEWAMSRLRQRTEKHKILIILSDGASVDDSTLNENGPDYLERHLRQVIAGIVSSGDVWLGAVGIGYAVDHYYPVSTRADLPEDLPGALQFILNSAIQPKQQGI